VTEQGGLLTHYVDDEQMCATVQGENPRAVCGRRFVPAALITPPGQICPRCIDAIQPPRPTGVRRRRVAGRALGAGQR